MATFGHITRERCTQLAAALTAAGLPWEDNGHQDDPQFLTYTVTDPHGRRWSISPATGNQTTPSKPGHVWQASCASTLHRTAITTAQGAAAICEHPA
ncbi:hypothetical protein GCM10010358_68130 [Streptomyces minutiscleroticus]|uniref:Uncharacterized protein n=1 Tax=Streptomyces minutiscleroticus TaxID=68238 RepID=A0A918U703_9ACTN|nr:hypothetical protein [Streptomyces minutiscleroticus]GGY05117.1 hypothetical protein GCM10010358_68130 [Streptomyces minutiscleroticus]